MAAIFTSGVTNLKNCAKEPEVVDLINFLNSCGAKIEGAWTSNISITGVEDLVGGDWNILPDRIEAGTYLVAGAITNGHVRINNISDNLILPIIKTLERMVVTIKKGKDWVEVDATTSDLKSVDIETGPFPGFPTDMQAQFMTLNCISHGSSLTTETIFENRFQHVTELKKMGAKISLNNNQAKIEGVSNLVGSNVSASDLRASASLVLAGLVGKNRTQIDDIYHIDRGYECIEEKLNKLLSGLSTVLRFKLTLSLFLITINSSISPGDKLLIEARKVLHSGSEPFIDMIISSSLKPFSMLRSSPITWRALSCCPVLSL